MEEKNRLCKEFFKEARKVDNGETFINPFTGKRIIKGKGTYHTYAKDCQGIDFQDLIQRRGEVVSSPERVTSPCKDFLEQDRLLEDGDKVKNPFTGKIIIKGKGTYAKVVTSCREQVQQEQQQDEQIQVIASPEPVILGSESIEELEQQMQDLSVSQRRLRMSQELENVEKELSNELEENLQQDPPALAYQEKRKIDSLERQKKMLERELIQEPMMLSQPTQEIVYQPIEEPVMLSQPTQEIVYQPVMMSQEEEIMTPEQQQMGPIAFQEPMMLSPEVSFITIEEPEVSDEEIRIIREEEDIQEELSEPCRKFLERTEGLKDGQTFINPFTGKKMKIGSMGYKKLFKQCNQGGNPSEVIYKKYSCDGYKKKPGFQPQPHQQKFLYLFQQLLEEEGEQRGLLAYFGLGSGKTCTYALAIDAFLDAHPDRQIYIFTNASLRTNLLTEYCSFCGRNPSHLPEFIFLSLNDTTILNKLPPTFDSSLVVIDEIHHLTHGKYNEGPLLSGLYDRIVSGKNMFIIGGSGTPIETHVEELFYLSKLFNPSLWFNMDYFMNDLHLDNGVYYPKYKQQFQEKICSFICYYEPIHDLSSYPSVYHVKKNVRMNRSRINRYMEVIEEEFSRAVPPKESLKITNPQKYKEQKMFYYIAITHMKSSQLSNFEYPRLTSTSGTPLTTNSPDEVEPKGWVSEEVLDILPEQGEKINVILQDILDHEGKHVIYTRFKTRYGSWLIGALCEVVGIPYRFFDGDMNDEDRLKVISEYNNPSNNDGDNIKVLIMTEAAQEGLNLLAVRRLHILEQPVNKTSLDQVIGRAVRYRSHVGLPEDERNVTIINYFIALEDPLDTSFYSADYLCYESAMKKEKSISEIKLLMKSCRI